MIRSAGVMVDCVMYFVLKNTVSDTLSLFVCLTYITWHWQCSGDVCKYHPFIKFSAHDAHLVLLWCNCTAHPIGVNGILF